MSGKRRGRPKSTKPTREKTVAVRLTKEEYFKLKAEAGNISEYIRELIQASLNVR